MPPSDSKIKKILQDARHKGDEPIHVYCRKGNAKGKFWILPDEFEIKKAYVRYMTRREERQIRRILFDHLDEIIEEWNEFKEGINDSNYASQLQAIFVRSA